VSRTQAEADRQTHKQANAQRAPQTTKATNAQGRDEKVEEAAGVKRVKALVVIHACGQYWFGLILSFFVGFQDRTSDRTRREKRRRRVLTSRTVGVGECVK